jgi:hypothetical protein
MSARIRFLSGANTSFSWHEGSVMSNYTVYVDGIEQPVPIKASSFNKAEGKAKKKYPGKNIQVVYTEQ